jgi:hypothetical protein
MMATKKTMRCARSKIVISSPKKSGQNQKRPHRTRVGSRGLRKAMHRHHPWPRHQREPARLPWWCSKSYGATPATWRIFAAPAWVSIKRSRAGFTKKSYFTRFARDPCAPRGRAILDLIARIYRRAGACVAALVFSLHCFDHGAALSNCAVNANKPLAMAAMRTRRDIRVDPHVLMISNQPWGSGLTTTRSCVPLTACHAAIYALARLCLAFMSIIYPSFG